MIDFIKRKYKLLLIIIAVLAIGLVVYNNLTAGSKSKEADTARVRRGDLKEILTISGTVDAEEHTTLRFQTSGRLSWVGVKEGDYVKKYQMLASLDQREVQKALQKYLNTYAGERNDFDQTTRDDYKYSAMTDAIKRALENAQYDLNNAVLDVELKSLAVEYSRLWTPIEGIVTRVSTPYAGVNITPAGAEFEVVNPRTIYFSANADQTEVTALSEGMPGELTLDSYPDSTFSGTIKNISFTPKTDESGTVYGVKFFFDNDNSSYKYRMGMAGDLTFVTAEKKGVLYLPVKFVKSENGKKYVLRKINGKTEKTYVTAGLETDDDVEITSGLGEGDQVTTQ